MKIQRLKRITLIISSLMLASCEMVVDVDMPAHHPVLVVNSLFSPESQWLVRVNHSKAILDTSRIQPVKNATVEISSDRDGAWQLSRNVDGYYYNNAMPFPKPGVTYTLNVSAPGFDAVTASCTLPKSVPINNISTRKLENNFNGDEFEVTINFTDPPEPDNYYQLIVTSQENLDANSFYMDYVSDDPVFGKDEGTVFSDDLFNSKDYSLKIRLPRHLVLGKIFWVNFITASKDYYTYFKSYRQFQDTYENPLAEPVFVYSNIENGLGIFAGLTPEKQSVDGWPVFVILN